MRGFARREHGALALGSAVDLALAGVEGLEPPTPGFGGREALFGLILAYIGQFDFLGISASLQQRATDPITLLLGPNLGPRFH